jgi:hypothetical protein
MLPSSVAVFAGSVIVRSGPAFATGSLLTTGVGGGGGGSGSIGMSFSHPVQTSKMIIGIRSSFFMICAFKDTLDNYLVSIKLLSDNFENAMEIL